MKKEISCSNTFLPYVSDKTKKMGKYLFTILKYVYLCVKFNSVT